MYKYIILIGDELLKDKNIKIIEDRIKRNSIDYYHIDKYTWLSINEIDDSKKFYDELKNNLCEFKKLTIWKISNDENSYYGCNDYQLWNLISKYKF